MVITVTKVLSNLVAVHLTKRVKLSALNRSRTLNRSRFLDHLKHQFKFEDIAEYNFFAPSLESPSLLFPPPLAHLSFSQLLLLRLFASPRVVRHHVQELVHSISNKAQFSDNLSSNTRPVLNDILLICILFTAHTSPAAPCT